MAKVVRMPPASPDRRAVHLHGHQLYHQNRMRAVEKEFPGNQDYVVTPSGHEERVPGFLESVVLWILGHRD